MSAPWQILGISPTKDAADIRRAYAAKLRITRPDRDPKGFAELRTAYEAALSHAAAQQPPTPKHATAEDTAAPVAREGGAAGPPAEPATPSPFIKAFVSALNAGKITEAADALDAALRHGGLPIQAEMQFSSALLEALIRQPDLPLDLLTSTARRFNWQSNPAAFAGPAAQLLQARIEAETWFAALRRLARSPTRFLGFSRPGAAQLLLGRGYFIFSWYLPPQPPLLDMLSQLRVHGPWLPGRFNTARIARVERLIAQLAEGAGGLRKATTYVLSLLPAVAIFVASGYFLAALFFFNFLRAMLARSPRLKRPFSIVGTLGAVVAIAMLSRSADGLTQLQPYINVVQTIRQPASTTAVTLPPNILAASRAGDSDAIRVAGETLLSQATTTHDFVRAATWLSAAANRGNLQAMLDLDRMYLNGGGLLYDSLRAYFWSGVACRIARTRQEKQTSAEEHRVATQALYWGNRPSLDKQIKSWHPNAPPLPE